MTFRVALDENAECVYTILHDYRLYQTEQTNKRRYAYAYYLSLSILCAVLISIQHQHTRERERLRAKNYKQIQTKKYQSYRVRGRCVSRALLQSFCLRTVEM